MLKTESPYKILNNLNNTFVIGYYGGLNYGDELLLELILSYSRKIQLKNIKFFYSKPEIYDIYHINYGYELIPKNVRSFIGAIFTSKNIIIGGGGHWGMDSNLNILLLSVLLFFGRLILRKRIYLVGVGYYGSSNNYGKLSAFITSKIATLIYARDEESYENFVKLAPKNTILSSDLAEELGGFEISAVDSKISSEFSKFIEKQSSKKVTIYTLRRFTNKELEIKYTEKLYIHLLKNSKPSILLYMEPFEYYDSSSFTKINKLADDDRLLILNFNYNPIHLYYYLKQYNKKLVIAGLQYHLILSGIIAGCKIWPIYYDNKVKNILTKYGYVEPVNIRDIDFENLQ